MERDFKKSLKTRDNRATTPVLPSSNDKRNKTDHIISLKTKIKSENRTNNQLNFENCVDHSDDETVD